MINTRRANSMDELCPVHHLSYQQIWNPHGLMDYDCPKCRQEQIDIKLDDIACLVTSMTDRQKAKFFLSLLKASRTIGEAKEAESLAYYILEENW